ncbi:ABC transporter permease, partial [Corynebacterium felinum]
MLIELFKIKRSPVWLVCLIVPILTVAIGVINYGNNLDQFENGWQSFTAQTGLFYTLLFFSLSVGVFSATIWNDDKRPCHWNALILSNESVVLLLVRKLIATVVLAAVMHIIYCSLTVLAGVVLSINGVDPLAQIFHGVGLVVVGWGGVFVGLVGAPSPLVVVFN